MATVLVLLDVFHWDDVIEKDILFLFLPDLGAGGYNEF